MPPTPTHDELVRKISILERDAADYAQAGDKLYSLEHEKKAILDSMQEHVIYLDAHHRVVWANQAARKKAGMTDAELKGCQCFKLWYHENKPCRRCPVTDAL